MSIQKSLVDAAYEKWLQNINVMTEYLAKLQEENRNKEKLMRQMIREASLEEEEENSMTKETLKKKFIRLFPKYFKQLAAKKPLSLEVVEPSICYYCHKESPDLDFLICTKCSTELKSLDELNSEPLPNITLKDVETLNPNTKDCFFAYPYHEISKEVELKMTRSIAQLYLTKKEIFYEGEVLIKDSKLSHVLQKEAENELILTETEEIAYWKAKSYAKRGIYPPVEIFFIERINGHGIRALCNIPNKTLICEYTGEAVPYGKVHYDHDHTSLFALVHDTNGEPLVVIDPKYISNIGRFINGVNSKNLDCQNVEAVTRRINGTTAGLVILYVSTREIKEGEELLLDYNGRREEGGNYPTDHFI